MLYNSCNLFIYLISRSEASFGCTDVKDQLPADAVSFSPIMVVNGYLQLMTHLLINKGCSTLCVY